MRAEEFLDEASTSSGLDIEIRYVEGMQLLKPGCRCDGVEAFLDGVKVGYLKFDYTTPGIMKAEVPTIWAFADDYLGICLGKGSSKHYEEMTTEDIYKMLKSLKQYQHLSPSDFPHADERTKQLLDAMGASWRNTLVMTEEDRTALLAMLKACEHNSATKKYFQKMQSYIEHHNKPFVAYANTSKGSNGLTGDNKGKGIGSLMYRAASKWIADRGIANGLYASSTQSDRAKALWDTFSARGWVTQDGERRYLDPAKYPHTGLN